MIKEYKVDDGWYKSENLRLGLLNMPEKWVKTMFGNWFRINYSKTTKHYDGVNTEVLMTQHFKERLYERTSIGITRFSRLLREYDLRAIPQNDDGVRFLEIKLGRNVYFVLFYEGNKDVLILSTIMKKETSYEKDRVHGL